MEWTVNRFFNVSSKSYGYSPTFKWTGPKGPKSDHFSPVWQPIERGETDMVQALSQGEKEGAATYPLRNSRPNAFPA
jgi:hypothetical protein